MTNIDEPDAPKRGRGRPPGRAATRHAPTVENPRATIGSNSGQAVALGRDGSELTRKRTMTGDIFHIPEDLREHGWDLQWNVIEVTGQPQTSAQLAMAENGWRPVEASRFPGRFMPEGYSGPIIRDGLRLEERPMALTEQARAEERAKANRQMSDQQQQLRLVRNLPDGFSRDNSRLHQMERAGTSRTIAPDPSVPRPALPIDAAG